MVNKVQAIALVRDFVNTFLSTEEWYKNIQPDIAGIILYGSVAKETHRLDSDIDILIIVPLNMEEKYTKGEYFYDYHGHTINIVLRSIERIRQIAKNNNDKFQKEVFRGSEIIKADKELTTLLEEIIHA